MVLAPLVGSSHCLSCGITLPVPPEYYSKFQLRRGWGRIFRIRGFFLIIEQYPINRSTFQYNGGGRPAWVQWSTTVSFPKKVVPYLTDGGFVCVGEFGHIHRGKFVVLTFSFKEACPRISPTNLPSDRQCCTMKSMCLLGK
jgi:hypothetical protein